jgi:hypothetical protein
MQRYKKILFLEIDKRFFFSMYKTKWRVGGYGVKMSFFLVFYNFGQYICLSLKETVLYFNISTPRLLFYYVFSVHWS